MRSIRSIILPPEQEIVQGGKFDKVHYAVLFVKYIHTTAEKRLLNMCHNDGSTRKAKDFSGTLSMVKDRHKTVVITHQYFLVKREACFRGIIIYKNIQIRECRVSTTARITRARAIRAATRHLQGLLCLLKLSLPLLPAQLRLTGVLC